MAAEDPFEMWNSSPDFDAWPEAASDGATVLEQIFAAAVEEDFSWAMVPALALAMKQLSPPETESADWGHQIEQGSVAGETALAWKRQAKKEMDPSEFGLQGMQLKLEHLFWAWKFDGPHQTQIAPQHLHPSLAFDV